MMGFTDDFVQTNQQWPQDAFDVNSMFDFFEKQGNAYLTSNLANTLVPHSAADGPSFRHNLSSKKKDSRGTPYSAPFKCRTISNPLLTASSLRTNSDLTNSSGLQSPAIPAVPANGSYLQSQLRSPLSGESIFSATTISDFQFPDYASVRTPQLGAQFSPIPSSLTPITNAVTPPSIKTPPSLEEDYIDELVSGSVVKGRRIHRDAEKQRRDSLRTGFERLKELLPPATISANKTWSQTKLLESGVEYIERLLEEIREKDRDNRKLKEAVKKIVEAHQNTDK
ncbi:hypothetical protein BDR26DRAFT_343698 [Obelidium mucronatum]|nr:hypothetical protein BDR26DRAFT_343698 [Obelidium mucronatum]